MQRFWMPPTEQREWSPETAVADPRQGKRRGHFLRFQDQQVPGRRGFSIIPVQQFQVFMEPRRLAIFAISRVILGGSVGGPTVYV
jgi:hypothetical protein